MAQLGPAPEQALGSLLGALAPDLRHEGPPEEPGSRAGSPRTRAAGKGARKAPFTTELFLGFVLFLLALGYLYEALEFLVTIWELTLFAPL